VSAPLSIERETSPPGIPPGDLPETRQVISKTHAFLKDYHKIQDGTSSSLVQLLKNKYVTGKFH